MCALPSGCQRFVFGADLLASVIWRLRGGVGALPAPRGDADQDNAAGAPAPSCASLLSCFKPISTMGLRSGRTVLGFGPADDTGVPGAVGAALEWGSDAELLGFSLLLPKSGWGAPAPTRVTPCAGETLALCRRSRCGSRPALMSLCSPGMGLSLVSGLWRCWAATCPGDKAETQRVPGGKMPGKEPGSCLTRRHCLGRHVCASFKN